MKIKTFLYIAGLALLFLTHFPASAASFSFTGNFSQDSDVQFFNFSIASDSSAVTIQTLSLNGGTNNAGSSIASGGFDTYLALYNQSTGDWVTDTLNKAFGAEAVIDNALLIGALSAGNYVLALTQFDNVAAGLNLSDGFANDFGLATFATPPFTTRAGGGSGHWALDILLVDSANMQINNVGAPETMTLILLGLVGLVAITRSKMSLAVNI